MNGLPDPDFESIAEEKSGALAVIIDAVGACLGQMPSVLKKNVAKAFNHLMKVPNAYVDGWAAEVKATSDARVLLTKATGKALAKSIEADRSLVAVATATHASRILRQQINVAKVLEQTALEMNQEAPATLTEEVEDISEDWLNAFEREAVDMSSDQMQKLFGKILAGEIKRPKSYSIRTVKLMAQLDNRAAELFRKLCSLSCTLHVRSQVIDSRVVTVGATAAQNGLQPFGLGFAELNVLLEYGLIISDFDSYQPYAPAIVKDNKVALAIRYMNRNFALLPKQPLVQEQQLSFRANGPQLSQAGKELLGIVELEENLDYSDVLMKYFEDRGYTTVPVQE